MTKKTVIIYNDTGTHLRFAVVDGDYSHLDGVYINEVFDDYTLQKELSKLIYTSGGQELLTFVDKFPTKAVLDGAEVIVCGFYA